MKSITIIGAGASGMAAAIVASKIINKRVNINLIERNSRVGKKLLSTGNGRCNLSNTDISAINYKNDGTNFALNAINKFNVEKTLNFFSDLGLLCKKTAGGRVYPYCEQASAVLDVLRNEITHQKINLITDTKVIKVMKSHEGFELCLAAPSKKESMLCSHVIISTGGMAAPKTGSDGNGFELLTSLGHSVSNVTPALTQIKTDNLLTKPLKGIKINGNLKVMVKNKLLEQTYGEIIFTDYGLSGTAVFDISGTALLHANAYIILDLFPGFDKNGIAEMLRLRRQGLGHLMREEFFTGLINKRLGQILFKHSGVNGIDGYVSAMSDEDITRLSHAVKNLRFSVKGHTGWDFAQTSLGGVTSAEFCYETMESKKICGLYVTGELFDFAGKCGGYNLQWAWTSGILAGEAAAKSIEL